MALAKRVGPGDPAGECGHEEGMSCARENGAWQTRTRRLGVWEAGWTAARLDGWICARGKEQVKVQLLHLPWSAEGRSSRRSPDISEMKLRILQVEFLFPGAR